jgi:hypothetical protein
MVARVLINEMGYKAPPDERGGNRYVQPTATAPHLDSTNRVILTMAGNFRSSPTSGHGMTRLVKANQPMHTARS